MKTIPFAKPGASTAKYRKSIDAAITRVLDSGWYILGEEVKSFEANFASWLGSKYSVGVANGTDAIILSLRALGVGPGDWVVTVSSTAVATVSAVDLVGARAILVDIDPKRMTMSPAALKEALEQYKDLAIKAIVVVHLYGHPADIEAILSIAAEYGIPVVEDCAQAHGAQVNGKTVGTWGKIASYSFYPTKNLGAIGDGGAVGTDDDELIDRCRLIRQYGWRKRYISEISGMNSRLDEMQAAILSAKLPFLSEDNARRREIAAIYQKAQNPLLIHPTEAEGCYHVYHQYGLQSEHRDALVAFLAEKGITTGLLYPMPVHLQPGYSELVKTGSDMSETVKHSERISCLPIYPELTNEDCEYVVECLMEFKV